MNRILRLAFAATLLGGVGLAAQADDTKPGDEKMPYSDEMFVKKASIGGLFEVQAGNIATKNGDSQGVKDFGTMMVKDHTKANKELMTVAKEAGLQVETKLDAKHMKKVQMFRGLTGDAFDKEYMKDMVKDHEMDIKEFEEASTKATNSAVKQFATKTLPTLRKHLAAAKKVSDMEKQ
jgi:putative membrane protein